MSQRDVAPWAEEVPEAPYPMSLEAFEHWPEDAHYELVRGRLVRLPVGGGWQGIISITLPVALHRYVEEWHLGDVLPHCGFILDLPGEPHATVLLPSVAFVPRQRLPAPDDREAWNRPLHLAPDLVGEIARVGQDRASLAVKGQVWLAAGTRLVWIVWPEEQQVEVWPAGRKAPSETRSLAERLDGQEVLPGFSLPVASLFQV